MLKRVIVHADLNHCYAQIEEMMDHDLRLVPMAVGGHEESRHGIILAKNDLAKKYKIKTGESLRDAYAKCPELVIIHPKYEKYMYYTNKVKDIYREYSDKVESFGMDEAWIDLTGTEKLFGDQIETAKRIQKRVLDEIGLTVSMGISYNKIFAKLGSDMDKHMGFTVISQENFKEVVFPLACEDLLYVGRQTQKRLYQYGIVTIGEIANSPLEMMKKILGKSGELIWYFANGYDISEVKDNTYQRQVKSVGNSITAVRDMLNSEDIQMVLNVLSEAIASRLKELGLKGSVISVNIRDNALVAFSRQRKVELHTNISVEILEVAMDLIRVNCPMDSKENFINPYRSVGISLSNLILDTAEEQLTLFGNDEERQKLKQIDNAMDDIRRRFGFNKVKKLSSLVDKELTDFDPKGDHVVFPESWFK